jgi:GTP pyrophosphokinase
MEFNELAAEFPALKALPQKNLEIELLEEFSQYTAQKSFLCAAFLYANNFMGIDFDLLEQNFGKEIAQVIGRIVSLNQGDQSILEEYEEIKLEILIYLLKIKIDFMKLDKKSLSAIYNREQIQFSFKILEKLDITQIRVDLEDYFFEFLEPEVFAHYSALLNFNKEKFHQRETKLVEEIDQLLERHKISAYVESRLKSIYSIYQKIQKKSILHSQVMDTIGIRVIAENERDCYRVMDLIADKYATLNNKVKDYIALPKSNGYKSIHMTVEVRNFPVEIQIRTMEMHIFALFGKAAHHSYKKFKK